MRNNTRGKNDIHSPDSNEIPGLNIYMKLVSVLTLIKIIFPQNIIFKKILLKRHILKFDKLTLIYLKLYF